MWGKGVKDKWGDTVEFVGLCDPNPKRAEVVRQIIGVDCPVFTDFDAMVKTARPELVAITTVDAYHADYIVRALTDYKNGSRKNMVMAPMAANLSREDIEALAAFYSAQKPALRTVPVRHSFLSSK